MKKKTLLAIPKNPRPPKARLEEAAKAKYPRQWLVTAKTHQAQEGTVLAVDVWDGQALQAREIFTQSGSRTVLLPDGTTSRKGLWKVCHGREPHWVFPAAARRTIEGFFPLPPRAPESAEELITFLEHGKVRGGRMEIKGAGKLGGYTADELHQPLPENWKQIMMEHTDAWKTEILLITPEKFVDPITGLKKKGIRCTCTACRESYLEPLGWYSDGDMDICHQCGAAVKVVKTRKNKLSYMDRRYSILHFHRHQDTAVAEGYEIEYYITEDGKRCWDATQSHVYAWGPYGNYAYNNYYTYPVSGIREYLESWYNTSMTDTWNCGSETVVLPPPAGELDGTPLENARLEKYLELSKRYTKYPAPVRACTLAYRAPVMEAFVDMEDTGSIWAATTGRLLLATGETKPHKALGISKPEYQRYLKHEWGWNRLKWYKRAMKSGWKITEEELLSEDAEEFFRVNWEQRSGVWYVPLQKLWNYLHRTERREVKRMCRAPLGNTFSATIERYLDYQRMALDLRLPMETEDDRMPYDLFRRHDRMVEELNRRNQERAERIRKKQEAEDAKKAADFEKMWKRIRWANWSDENLLVVAAKSTAELQEEGRALHHCVGGYTGEVLAGRVIFFIRKAEAPDTPYYTLQVDIKTGKMLQLHGYGNREQQNDKNFPAIKAWAERWVEEIWKPGIEKRAGKAA